MLEINVLRHLMETPELSWVSAGAKERMAREARLEIYHSREIVFQGRAQADRFFIVISGNLEVLECSAQGEQLKNILYEKDSFGASFLYQKPLGYECMVVASAETLVASLPIPAMRVAILASPGDAAIYGQFSAHFDSYHFIKNFTTFGDHLSTSGLVSFVSSFERKVYPTDGFVFRQGDDPDGYYICIEGLLKVIVTAGGKEVFTTLLKAGDYFGELAMLKAAKRAAAIMALQHTECYFLSLSAFNELVKAEPSLMEGFRQLARLAYG